MGLALFIISSIVIVILSAVVGFVLKGKTSTRKAWTNFSLFMQWATYLLIFASFIVLILFRDEFLATLLASEFIQGLTVLTILIIGFPLLTLITIGFWIGDFFEWLYRVLSK